MFIRYDVAHGKAMPAEVVGAVDIEVLKNFFGIVI